MCNMYLQDRHAGRSPRWRGVTLLHEMKARGIPVAVASDNTRDPFYAYGDLDPLEVFREACRILQLDHPIGDWPAAIARDPAAIIGRPEFGRIAVDLPADLVLVRARSWTELLARPQADRTVLRSGKPIERELPDYRELDDLMRKPS
jgi:cytosine deaminase